jgi:hypothetical protein
MERLDLLLPEPKKMASLGESFVLGESASVKCAPAGALEPPALRRLEALLAERGVAVRRVDAEVATFELVSGVVDIIPQGYRLELAPGRVRLEARDSAGLFYAVCTLAQLFESAERGDGKPWLPSISIDDAPDFSQRGVLLDVSRDKVPTMATLLGLVDRLAGFKVNQLQLYVEHTFAYEGHERVWRDASPLLPSEILELDRYCRERHVELVPNQNSFGHLARWLVHAPYRRLAECPEGFEHPWNPSRQPFSLCATDPGSLTFLSDLYDQLLPNFTSTLFNVGCDETIDLGLGRSNAECARLGTERVYVDYLCRVHDLVSARGRRMQFWGDIIAKRPELISELPKDAIVLEWGYEAEHPWKENLPRFAEAGLEFYVCPGTSSWNSIAGRTDNALRNIEAAVRAGREHGARGVLNTDWGDNGHLQPLVVSYLGFLAGAALAWNASSRVSEREKVGDLLDQRWFRDPGAKLGRVAFDLGNAYREAGKALHNGSLLFRLLLAGENVAFLEGVDGAAFDRARRGLEEASATLESASPVNPEGIAAKSEFEWAARLLEFSCRLGAERLPHGPSHALARLPEGIRRSLSSELGTLIEQHRSLWLRRNRQGGLRDSVARLERTRSALSNG